MNKSNVGRVDNIVFENTALCVVTVSGSGVKDSSKWVLEALPQFLYLHRDRLGDVMTAQGYPVEIVFQLRFPKMNMSVDRHDALQQFADDFMLFLKSKARGEKIHVTLRGSCPMLVYRVVQ